MMLRPYIYMERKRRLCDHCGEFVSHRIYRLHLSLYYDERCQKWQHNQPSSDDESNTDIYTDVDNTCDQNDMQHHDSNFFPDGQETNEGL